MSCQPKQIPLIFRKGQIGGVQAHNRIIRSATFEGFASNAGCSTLRLENCYSELAKGKCGLIISSGVFTEQEGRLHFKQLGLVTKEQVDSAAVLVEKVHRNKGILVFQLSHSGIQGVPAITGSTPIGPSKIYKNGRAMTEEEISRVVKSFVNAASHAYSIGADGIQLHAAHGYLLAQFLSPIWNKRNDAYGGSVSKRFEIIRQIVGGIREKVPSSFSVSMKMNGSDIEPNGVTLESAIQTAKLAEKCGIDGLEISSGSGRKPYSILSDIDYDYCFKDEKRRQIMKQKLADIKFKPHFNHDFAKAIKKEVKIPIISVGGWRTLKEMSQAIDNHECDFVSLSRPFIRDPHLVENMISGHDSTCIRCNRCFFINHDDHPLKCLRPY